MSDIRYSSIVIDMGSIWYIDSTVVNILIKPYELTDNNNKAFQFQSVISEVMKLFNLLKPESIFDIEEELVPQFV